MFLMRKKFCKNKYQTFCGNTSFTFSTNVPTDYCVFQIFWSQFLFSVHEQRTFNRSENKNCIFLWPQLTNTRIYSNCIKLNFPIEHQKCIDLVLMKSAIYFLPVYWSMIFSDFKWNLKIWVTRKKGTLNLLLTNCQLFVCLEIFVPLENFSLNWRLHH